MSEGKTRDEAAVKIACSDGAGRRQERPQHQAESRAHRDRRRPGCASHRPAGAVQHRLRVRVARGGLRARRGGSSRADVQGLDGDRGPARLHLVAGINEWVGRVPYNAAVVVGPSGHVGTSRKVHLWNEENLFFEPGNLGFPVFRTPVGRTPPSCATTGGSPSATGSVRCRAQISSVSPRTGSRSRDSRPIARRWLISSAWRAHTRTRCSWPPPPDRH
jgi:hypothetical protein